MKLRSCRWPPGIRKPSSFVSCLGSSAFLIVDLTFHGQWNIFPVRPSLANRKGASVEVVLARCRYCSFKLCLLFSPNQPRSLQQRQLPKNHNFGISSYKLPSSKLVLKKSLCSAKKWSCDVVASHQFSQGDPSLCLVWEDVAFLIVDLIFHGQWHSFQALGQRQCSGKFACLANHPSLATGKAATFEVVEARCQKCSSKPCFLFSADEPRSLQQMMQLPKNFIQLWDS